MQRLFLLAAAVLFWAFGLRADTSVVFNELMYHPHTNNPALQWVEFHNQLGINVDVSGWSLRGPITYSFPQGTVIPGRGYLVVSASPADLAAAFSITNVLGPFTGVLSNSAAVLSLHDNNGRIVNQLDYDVEGSWPAAPNGSGASLAKVHPATGSGPAANWFWSDRIGGSPGTTNTTAVPGGFNVVFNEISDASPGASFVELANLSTNSAPLGGFSLAITGSTNADFTFGPEAVLEPGAFLSLTPAQIGFTPSSGDNLFLLAPGKTQVVDGLSVRKRARSRFPDFSGPWRISSSSSSGTSNIVHLVQDIVINEIMYHHQLLPPVGDLPQQASGEEWIELHNRGSNTVDLSGWNLDGGVDYQFPLGTLMLPGSYLVIAKDAAKLELSYPTIRILGDFGGNLSNDGDRITLEDANGNPADMVSYFQQGRWSQYADGGGPSLELRNPFADNSVPESWLPSAESDKGSWETISYEAAGNNLVGPSLYNDLILGLQNQGECLIDQVSVLQILHNRQTELIVNGDFENGINGWHALGNHGTSIVIADPANPANHVLHLVASGTQEHMHNHIEQTLATNISDGATYRISFRAKWITGNNLINSRLFFNRVAKTTRLSAPQLNGTPGTRNSRYEPNSPPTFTGLRHWPIVPEPAQPVTVSILPSDPQGILSCRLFWSADDSSFTQVAMSPQPDGTFLGVIPGYPAGSIVQFYILAQDTQLATSAFPATGYNSGALYKVQDGGARLDLGHNFRVVLTRRNWALLRASTNLMSSANLPCTIIYDEQRPYYGAAVRLKGSMMGRVGDTRPSFNVTFQPDDTFLGEHPSLLLDCSGRPGSPSQQAEILVHHLALHAGGIPYVRPDLGWVIPPRQTDPGPAVIMPRLEDEFIETAYDNGSDGPAWLFELIYWGTQTNEAGYKLPTGAQYMGADLRSMGENKETYRYYFPLKTHHNADDYSRLISMLKVFDLSPGPILEQQARQVINVDQWLRAFAFVSLVGESDFYTFGNPHNLVLYLQPSDHRMQLLPYDVEQLFRRAPDAPLIGTGSQYWNDIADLPANRRRLYAHALDIIATTYNADYMTPWVEHYATLAPGQDFSDLLSFIAERTPAVLAEIAAAGGNAPFSMQSPNALTNEQNLVTISGTAPLQVQAITINGVAYPITWNSVSTWSISIPLSHSTNDLQLLAFDLNGAPLPDYSTNLNVVCTGNLPTPSADLVISEIYYNPAIPGSSFVEIYNRSASVAYDLSNWRLDGVAFNFPPGTIIGTHQYVVVAEDQAAFIAAFDTGILPAGFYSGTLQLDGEMLKLMSGATIINRIRYGVAAPWPATSPGNSLQVTDLAQANSRVLNWRSAAPTPGRANNGAAILAPFQEVWLNELQPENLAGITNEAGLRSPWIEVFNPGSQPVSLDNVYLSVSYASPGQWSFPPGLILAPGQFQVVFADGFTELSTPTEPHTSFTLPANSGVVALTRKTAGKFEMLDFVTYTNVAANRSYGSLPDGQCFDRFHFFIPSPGMTNSLETIPVSIAINEWMAANTSGLRNPLSGKFSDWFELYNYGTNTANLEGFYLSDNPTNKLKFAIPAGYQIAPQSFLIVFADERNTNGTPELHVNFKMSKSGESIGLFTPDGQTVDFVSYGVQTENVSQGRFPDGAIPVFSMPTSTPGTNNIIPNTPPMIAQLPELHLYQGQTARYTVLATDSEVPFQTLAFSLETGADPAATITPATGIFVWPTGDAAAPTTNSFAITVSDNGIPSMSDTDLLSVVVLPAPQLALVLGSNVFSLQVETLTGHTYQIEYKDDLQEPFWTALSDPIAGTGSPITVDDIIGDRPQRYYRVVILD